MILADTHVHIHPCFDLNVFLCAAADNFRVAAATACSGQPYQSVLCLTESAGVDQFDRLKTTTKHLRGNGWSCDHTDEPCSLILTHATLGVLTILAGRQIVCKEGVELLALGTHQVFADGITLDSAIAQTLAANAVAVLPWGFGKWTGRRDRLIQQIMQDYTPAQIALGDNSGRLARWREPNQFTWARGQGFRIFPGSDPLPFAAEIMRVASYGIAISGHLSTTKPAHDLIEIFSDASRPSHPFGRLETPLRFVRNQLAMQWRKRLMQTAQA